MQLLIYTPTITPRIKYIFNFIFREIIRCDFEFTSVIKQFNEYQGPKFSYANKPLTNELFFCADGLLSNHHIEELTINMTDFGGQQTPFAVKNSALPFDIFSASFYFISRYEEYLPFEGDNHLRYPAKLSLQYQLNLLKQPIVDEWALILKNLLKSKLQNFQCGSRAFQFIPTIDVDRAYHFKSSGLLKNAARFVLAAVKRDKEKLKNIINTGLNRKNDPYDTYDILEDLHKEHGFAPIFFFLLSQNGNKNHDVNINPNDELLQKLIVNTSNIANVGIHPSYASNKNIESLIKEKQFLERLLDQKITASRQHYLKLHLPKTYLELISAGIYHDFSMGYASQLGFRAGTCSPFFWYDLQLEKQSHLVIHPFAVMDVALRQYAGLSPEEAIKTIAEMMDSVKIVGGTFYSLWHNEALSETGVWKGWRKVYTTMLEQASAS
jgi:hypothetical protein